ncbi:MAG: hypothetical protein P9M13_06715 [Candidatus Ancaeobacter aquaticus]|nr:hypothetical protein [Candidatus Ancaeobacter aquaticus]
MWWKWALFVLCAVSILACIISTTIDWFKGHTGPFGPKPEDWWGCGIFTIVLLLVMYWLGKKLF